MQRLLTTLVLTLLAFSLQAAQQQDGTKRVRYKDGPAYIYRVSLTDKAGTPYSFDNPTRFLSRRAIERRKRQGLAIDSTDLPVSSHYIHLIKKEGINIIGQSRWQNTILVRLKDSTLVNGIRQLPCVKDCAHRGPSVSLIPYILFMGCSMLAHGPLMGCSILALYFLYAGWQDDAFLESPNQR